MEALDRGGNSISNTDGLIAACALETCGRVVARNAKEFKRVAGLEVLSPSSSRS